MTQMGAGRALGGWEPELCLEEVLEFLSHGWLCQAALLKMCPEEIGCFCQVARECRRAVPRGPLFLSLGGDNPAVTLSMCDLGCGLAFLWALASPEPCCQSTEPVSHVGLSR